MIVCIAEKPSVAKDIAHVLGANSSHDGYMEGNGYQVTWTFGHLCTLKEPNDYMPNWKHWSLAALPMIPQRFGIKLIEDQGIKKQFSVIERLMQAADGIIAVRHNPIPHQKRRLTGICRSYSSKNSSSLVSLHPRAKSPNIHTHS